MAKKQDTFEDIVEEKPDEPVKRVITYADVNAYLVEAEIVKGVVELIAKSDDVIKNILEIALINIYKVVKNA